MFAGRSRSRGREGRATIAAVATAMGPGGVSVVRISGPDAHAVGRRVCPSLPSSARTRTLYRARFVSPTDGELLDDGLVVLFDAPNSFTGEDVVELHGHGGVAQCRALLRAAMEGGSRPALAGEFSRRAVENGRLDLARAEGIAEMVGAESDAALRAARSLLGGSVSREVMAALERVEGLLAEWEAALDFPDDLDDLEEAGWRGALEEITASVGALQESWRRGRSLRTGPRLVLCGPPNSGKSSLMNAMLGHERAIVDAIPGTTRDLLEARFELDGGFATIVDGAGIRDAESRVEAVGVERAEEAISSADVVIGVLDGSRPPTEEDSRALSVVGGISDRLIMVANKADLGAAGLEAHRALIEAAYWISTSAKEGTGIEDLEQAIRRLLFEGGTGQEGVVVTLERHHDALRSASGALTQALQALGDGAGLELASEGLREARGSLTEIVGRGDMAEELLDRVFATFCIGK